MFETFSGIRAEFARWEASANDVLVFPCSSRAVCFRLERIFCLRTSVSLPLALCSSMLLLRRPLSSYLSLSVTVHSCSSSLLPPFFGAFEQCSASETKFSGETKVISFVQSKLSDFREPGRLNAPPVGRNSHDAINPFSFFSPQLARLRRSSGSGDEGRKDSRSDEDYVVR